MTNAATVLVMIEARSQSSDLPEASQKETVLVVTFDVRRNGGMERLALDVVRGTRELGAACEFVDTRRIGGSRLGRLLGRLFFLGRLARAVPRADVVISMHHLFVPYIICCMALAKIVRRSGEQRLLCWIHGIEVWGDALSKARGMLQRCDGLIASSKFTRDRVLGMVGRWPACDVINPMAIAVDPAVMPTPMPKDLVLLTVARLTRDWDYKGHGIVLESLRLLDAKGMLREPFQWRIVGDGELRASLEKEVAASGLARFVHFLGSVDDDMLVEEYRRCSLFVMPSQYSTRGGRATGEGFGIVYLEAANAGRPSIACSEGGQTDLIEHGINGWLVADDPRELADLLERLLADPGAVERAGRAAHQIAVSGFGKARFTSSLRQSLRLRGPS